MSKQLGPYGSPRQQPFLNMGVDSCPPGGFVNFLKQNASSTAQYMSKASSSQPIDVVDDTNCGSRTEKRLTWTKEEDLVLIGAWLNNSKDPIHSNYKKNDQYWKSVTAAYNSAVPKSKARQLKQVKDHFGRIKKRVAWFCASWKEANAMWASGESDVNLMDRAVKLYEDEHKNDGPFMFKHCWEEDFGEHFSLNNVVDERPIGGKKAKEQQKRKRKDQACIIDIEDELHAFVEAQNKANEGCKEMLEAQKRVSNDNLEARKLAYLAAKENKESDMLETYRELLKQDATGMPEDVRAEHVLALKCIKEKLFGN
ncbi:hypothetical protein PAHAL_9G517700 [Panicum hallii]|uniref:No apical meristem-associated C-terminal domain-containing protein n=1 Tax=Panicum hallii TaxID=206008 RepID=A0A2S3ISW7_9POAL|nr:hypothetical protein PAHAL_9G517700 [Panicum hallii]